MARIFTIEDVKLIFKNFTGVETKFNKRGNRNFGVLIEDEKVALDLIEDGWNVRQLKPREDVEDETPGYWLPVAVKYAEDGDTSRDPNIFTITSRQRTVLTPETVGILDWAEPMTIDVSLNGSSWKDDDGVWRIKAYCKTLAFVMREDPILNKYVNVPESAMEILETQLAEDEE